ncbi:Ribosome biogenesis GTPase A [anaerobic digester metagenome]|nr:ribosome biogenesis GTPase YlqF [Clostridiaceae bacterium HFYG-1003]
MADKINWFPGHMVRTRREITENLKLCDAVIEIRDARIVKSSANPEVDRIVGTKPRIILLNKADLAEDRVTRLWKQELSNATTVILEVNSLTGEGLNKIKPALEGLLAEKLERMANKGLKQYYMRVMVVGIPNVGKSSFINRMAKNSIAKVGDRPGVTKNKQWIKTGQGIELLDTPGILWPKFEDDQVALNLAFTGAIKDTIMDIETLALRLIERLSRHYANRLADRYQVEVAEDGLATMEAIARKRGYLQKGREVDWTRTAVMLLDEFRGGKLGRISLEWPGRAVEEPVDHESAE